MDKPLKKGEMVSREDPNGIVVLKWKDSRDVRMISTKHVPRLMSVKSAKNPKPKEKMKPLAVIDYNLGKCGIDKSDQMVSYATHIRRSRK